MNVGVIFADTIKRYKQDKCSNTSSSTCLHNVFDGEEYFNDYILNHPGKAATITACHEFTVPLLRPLQAAVPRLGFGPALEPRHGRRGAEPQHQAGPVRGQHAALRHLPAAEPPLHGQSVRHCSDTYYVSIYFCYRRSAPGTWTSSGSEC